MKRLTKSQRCKGKLYNGPGKRYCRCNVCHRIDWEANEGDRCQYEKVDSASPKKGREG